MAQVLYVTYDGLMEPLGQSQVLPYVRGLAALGHRFEILSFEKSGVPLCYREQLEENIRWTALRYHRTPTLPATLFDMALGKILGAWLCLVGRVNLIHVRSYVPCMMMFAWTKISRLKLIFDTRGLWADEKADSGTWTRRSLVYRTIKWIEPFLFKHSDAIVVLTQAFKRYLADKTSKPIYVIPTCVDLDRFRKSAECDEGVLVYCGSLGGLYLDNAIERFYLHWKKHFSNPKLLLLTHSGSMREHHAVTHAEMPHWLSKGSAAICFIKPAFSKLSSAPTKLGEYLACGLPVAANLIGDMGEVLSDSQAGVVVDDFSDASLEKAAFLLAQASKNPQTRIEARALAERWFSLEQGVNKYDEIYRNLCAA